MQYTLLGRSGLAVSRLCLGTMTFGNATSEQDSIRMIHQFLDAGGNFVDTANVYVQGASETIVGKAIHERRSEVVLATKVRFATSDDKNAVGLSRKHIIDSLDASLRRLNTDYIDLYQMHVWDYSTPIEETLRVLDDLITAGKIRYIGCSNFRGWQIMKALSVSDANKYSRFVSNQPQYSLVSREMDREVLEVSMEEGVGTIPWAPLGSGFLSAKYTPGGRPESGRLHGENGESAWTNRFTEKNWAILRTVEEIAREVNKTPSQVSLNWLLKHPAITAPIFGARTLEQFADNMESIDWQLTDEQWNRLDEISRLPSEYPTRFIEKFRRHV